MTDRAAFADYHASMLKFARVLGKQHNRRPPRIAAGGRSDAIGAAMLALDIRRLGRDPMREFLRIAGINIFDVLEETFETPLLKGALALDAVLGTNLGAALEQLGADAAASIEWPGEWAAWRTFDCPKADWVR